jgi:hypothetical protein
VADAYVGGIQKVYICIILIVAGARGYEKSAPLAIVVPRQRLDDLRNELVELRLRHWHQDILRHGSLEQPTVRAGREGGRTAAHAFRLLVLVTHHTARDERCESPFASPDLGGQRNISCAR